MWAFIEHIGNSKKIRIGRNHEKKFKLKGKINTLGVQTLPSQSKRGLAHHDTAVADRDKAGEGRLLVRAVATIICVHKGMRVTDPASTSSRTK